MAYLSAKQLDEFGFGYVGANVKISEKASIYNPELIELHDNVPARRLKERARDMLELERQFLTEVGNDSI